MAYAAAVDADDLGGSAVLGPVHEVTLARQATLVAMRVVAGSLGGRRINAGDSENLRPTADRVREAMFNSLYSLGAIADSVVLDLFAGSGALGIEALSRGAARAVFVESDRLALAVLRENLESLGLADRATVLPADATEFLPRAGRYDLLLLDPPYSFDRWPELLGEAADSVVAIESDREVELPESWETHRVRRYGGTVVTLATAPAASENHVS